MKKKFKLGVIGAGFMATAIIKGAIKSSIIAAKDILVSDVSRESLDKMQQNGVSVTMDTCSLVNNSEFVLFAVKPQSLREVLEAIKDCNCYKFISIMAGVRKDKIKSVFTSAAVARCMPNTPCAIGCGAVGLDVSDYTDLADIEFVKNLLSSFAQVVIVTEDKMNAVTGVSGSSPAYFYLFLKGVIEAGVQEGLSVDEAKILAANTMIGAGKMVLNNPDKSLDELINAVCSKGGTTIEAVKVYNENGLNNITSKAVSACVKRSIELEEL